MQDWPPWTNALHIPKSCAVFDCYTLSCSCHTSDVSTLSIHKVLGIHELCIYLTCSLVDFENVRSSSDFMHFWTEVVNTVMRAKGTSCQNNCIYVTGQYVHVGRDIFPLWFYVLIKLLNDVQFCQKNWSAEQMHCLFKSWLIPPATFLQMASAY